MTENTRKALQLCLLTVVNYGLFFGIGVFLARVLSLEGFKDYNVALATLALLASLATLGLEKYAQRALTAYCESGQWSLARGFAFFGRNTVLLAAILALALYVLVAMAKWLVAETAPDWPTLLALLFLPVMVLALFMLEVLASTGEVVRSTVVYRVLLPVCIVLPLILIWISPLEMTAPMAVLSYGTAWVVSFLLLRRLALRSLPAEVMNAEETREPRTWLLRSAPFLVHSVMMTQFASLGIVGLEILGGDDHSVAILAAAMQTGSFIVLLATSTNRLYGPMASSLIERRDYDGMMATIRERHSWIIPATLIYFAAMVLFGRRILGLYGPDFAAGYPALCFIAGGASISVWFAMAPNYLKFVGRNRLVLGITAAAALLNLGLLVVLGPRFGATGAGAAYGISLAIMAVVFLVLGLRTAKSLHSA
jgi:O-antigen/teichoic acid export membrane protein